MLLKTKVGVINKKAKFDFEEGGTITTDITNLKRGVGFYGIEDAVEILLVDVPKHYLKYSLPINTMPVSGEPVLSLCEN